jgi:hypothetical protein
MRVLSILALSVSLVSASCGGDSGGDAIAPSVVGTWKTEDGARSHYYDFREDKTAYVLTAEAALTVCVKGRYAFGDGVLTIEVGAGGPQNDVDSFKAQLPDGDTLRLEESTGKTTVYRRAPLPANSCAQP